MKPSPTRFENALTLACAAITMLAFGELANGQLEDFDLDPKRLSLRQEFADILDGRRYGRERFFPVVCPEVEPPYWYETYLTPKKRLEVLMNVTVRPSIILACANRIAGTGPDFRLQSAQTPDQIRVIRAVGSELGVDTAHVRYIWRDPDDLDARQDALRTELEKMRREAARS